MSDIITAIKGQAAGAVTVEDSVFTIDETVKRCVMLMRHELMAGQCRLNVICDKPGDIALKGDVNNLVQVLTNLLSNAVYAQQQVGGGEITLRVECDPENLKISVADTGTGVSEKVKEKLFRAMVTSKGAMGTGLGLYISNTVIRGKFGGKMMESEAIRTRFHFWDFYTDGICYAERYGRHKGGTSDAKT